MNDIQSWVLSISAVTMIIAVVSVITPKNSAGRAVLLCGGIIMTAVLVLPLRNLNMDEIGTTESIYSTEISAHIESALQNNEKISDDIIEGRLQEYILQRAENKGVSCLVEISCKKGVPETAVITGKENEIDVVSSLISEELGIAPESQIFICGG